jgi:hypothetical protein
MYQTSALPRKCRCLCHRKYSQFAIGMEVTQAVIYQPSGEVIPVQPSHLSLSVVLFAQHDGLLLHADELTPSCRLGLDYELLAKHPQSLVNPVCGSVVPWVEHPAHHFLVNTEAMGKCVTRQPAST